MQPAPVGSCHLGDVLVADGARVARETLARMLRPFAGRVELAPDRAQAAARMAVRCFALVLADVDLPGGGAAALAVDVETAPGPHPLLVALLHEGAGGDARVGRADATLVKPVAPEDVVRLVHRLGAPRESARHAAPRLHARVPIAAVVRDENGRGVARWEVRDLSRSGALLLSGAPIPVGSEVSLELEADGRRCVVVARVVRVQEPRWGVLPGVGVSFRENAEPDARSLDDLLAAVAARAREMLAAVPPRRDEAKALVDGHGASSGSDDGDSTPRRRIVEASGGGRATG